MKLHRVVVVSVIVVVFLLGCAPKADFDVRGAWEYTMITTDGNTYDVGTITFSGEPEKGTYHEVNIYQVEYDGEYTVNGSNLKLTGYESWDATLVGENAIGGSWSHDDASGTFTANRERD